MILQRLSRLLGPDNQGVLRRYIWLTLVSCVVQGVTFTTVLPIVQNLLLGDPGRAALWLVPLLIGTGLTWWLAYIATLGGFQVAIRLLETLRHRIGDHVVTLPLGWFTPANTSSLGVTLSQGVMDILGLPAHQLTPLMRAVLTPCILTVAIAFYDWRVALTAAIAFPALAIVYWWAGRLGRTADLAVHLAAADASDRMVEFAQSQLVLRAHGCGERGHALFDAALEAQTKASRWQLWMVVPPLLANSWIAQASFLALMASVTSLAIGDVDKVHLAALIAILVLINRVVDPLIEVAAYSFGIRMASAQMDAVEKILATRPLPLPAVPAVVPDTHDVVLDDVTFGYDGRRPVVDRLNLTLPANTTMALVGVSGSGKTTILNLIARFWDPTDGAVRIGGVDLRKLGSGELMGLIAPVFQNTYLFSGTLRDNVLLGRPEASDGDLQRAAALAQLEDVVARLPEGWHSQVGEGGTLLSGGERQRVAIARALLKGAPILLFDEATGALDAETHAAVADGLSALHGRATMLVITHQLATTESVDCIAVIDDHRIVELGTHSELLRAGGRYADFWRARAASEGWRLKMEGHNQAPATRSAASSD